MSTTTRARPPGPKGRWLSGNLPEFRRDRLAFFTACARDYGDVVALRFGPRRVLVVNHPDLVEEVLVANNRRFIKHFALRVARSMLGNGLLTAEGDFWRRQRRLAQPAFHRDRVAGYAATMVEFTERMLQSWADGLAKRIPRYAYFPFGGGPRICIGNTFATMEAVLLLATIARRYRLKLAPGAVVTPLPTLTLRPEHGVKVVLERRS